MDWQTLFLSSEGRMGQKDFWIGIILLFVSGMIMQNVPMVDWIWSLASVYFGFCVYAKRLHDIGKSAWLFLVPAGIMLTAAVLAGVLGGMALLTGAASGSDALTAAGGLAGFGLAGLVIAGGALGCIGFVIWLGTRPSDAIDNQYGPPREVALVTMV